jgi:hypothetical protein
MIVVHVQRDVVARRAATDEAAATLRLKHGVVLLNGHAELPHQVSGPLSPLGFRLGPTRPLRSVDPLGVLLLPALHPGDRCLRVCQVPPSLVLAAAALAFAAEAVLRAGGSVKIGEGLRYAALLTFLHNLILPNVRSLVKPIRRCT